MLTLKTELCFLEGDFYPQPFDELKGKKKHCACLFTVPSVLPDSVRSEAVNWQDRAPTDKSLPTPLLFAPAPCPTPTQERRWKNRKD